MHKIFHKEFMERMQRNGYIYWFNGSIFSGNSDRRRTYLPYSD